MENGFEVRGRNIGKIRFGVREALVYDRRNRLRDWTTGTDWKFSRERRADFVDNTVEGQIQMMNCRLDLGRVFGFQPFPGLFVGNLDKESLAFFASPVRVGEPVFKALGTQRCRQRLFDVIPRIHVRCLCVDPERVELGREAFRLAPAGLCK